MNVTVRVPAELYDEFQSVCNSRNKTITSILVAHIEQQADNYKIPKSNDKDYDNYTYKKVNFRIDSDSYAKYKIELIKNRTNPTADIIRFMREFVG